MKLYCESCDAEINDFLPKCAECYCHLEIETIKCENCKYWKLPSRSCLFLENRTSSSEGVIYTEEGFFCAGFEKKEEADEPSN